MRRESRTVKMWRERNPEKYRAHMAVYSALRNGSMKREACFCGEEKVEAHHPDHSRPLEVVWLCKAHHVEADMERRKVIHSLQGYTNVTILGMSVKNKKATPVQSKADKLIKVRPETHRKLKIEAATQEKSIGKLLDDVADGFRKR